MSLYDSEGHEAKNDATLHAQKVVTVCLDANGVERPAGVDGAKQALADSRPLVSLEYTDGGYTYYLDHVAIAGADTLLLSAATWRVIRKELATGYFCPAGLGEFDQVGTFAGLAALDYCFVAGV